MSVFGSGVELANEIVAKREAERERVQRATQERQKRQQERAQLLDDAWAVWQEAIPVFEAATGNAEARAVLRRDLANVLASRIYRANVEDWKSRSDLAEKLQEVMERRENP